MTEALMTISDDRRGIKQHAMGHEWDYAFWLSLASLCIVTLLDLMDNAMAISANTLARSFYLKNKKKRKSF